jgi:peptidoglycan/xylan/chitin deacetylase (PgdA/CDA1 family)
VRSADGNGQGGQAHERKKPRASISLDLDNLWSYMKIHGDAGWASFPSYLDQVVEIVVDRLRAHGLTVTIFVVGQDAALAKNASALRAVADAGHEIANQSFSHEPWLHTYSYAEIAREIADAETAIERATGQKPRGFRGPGFSLSPDTLRVLAERQYVYDASTFPTFLGPLARAYYFLNSGDLSDEEREQRKRLFGTMSDGLRAIKPYVWNVPLADGHPLLEIPVTTMPFLRVPIHMSYIGYLAVHSRILARAYARAALSVLERTGTDLSFLLHPLDFVGKDRESRLGFFPGMSERTDDKLRLFDEVIALIKQSFEPVTMGEHARVLLDGGRLKTRVLG